ncbi:MAG: hypothetical protein JNJ45_11845 [Chthonomonas sp.]|nr:hypothetical protein [Chthonomonas sp.]
MRSTAKVIILSVAIGLVALLLLNAKVNLPASGKPDESRRDVATWLNLFQIYMVDHEEFETLSMPPTVTIAELADKSLRSDDSQRERVKFELLKKMIWSTENRGKRIRDLSGNAPIIVFQGEKFTKVLLNNGEIMSSEL